MAYDLDKFQFHADLIKKSAGNFEAFLKERYGDLKVKERKYLVNKFYGTLDVEHGDDNPIAGEHEISEEEN